MNIGNPINIGEALRESLTASKAVYDIVGSHIYPYTTKTELNQPHVVYDDISVEFYATKDGLEASSANVAIHANASDYTVSKRLASAIIDTLLESGPVSSMSVGCDLNDAANMYVHTINITIQL